MTLVISNPTDITENGVRITRLATNPIIQGTIDPGTGLTIPAHTLSGKLTAGASEIEGSAFDINGGTIDGVTITSPTINGTIATTGLTLPAHSSGAITLGATNVIIQRSAADTFSVSTNGVIGLRVVGGQVKLGAGAGATWANRTWGDFALEVSTAIGYVSNIVLWEATQGAEFMLCTHPETAPLWDIDNNTGNGLGDGIGESFRIYRMDYLGGSGHMWFTMSPTLGTRLYTMNDALDTAVSRLHISSDADTAIATWSDVTHSGFLASGNILLNTGLYVGLDASSNLTFVANDVEINVGSGYLEIDTTGKTGLQMDGGIVTGSETILANVQNILGGAFTATGTTWAQKNRVAGVFTTPAGFINGTACTNFENTVTTQNNTETIVYVTQVRIVEPVITNGTDTITLAASLIVDGAPTEGATNAAICIVSGDQKWLGSVDSAAVADQVAIGGYEIGVGNRVLAISQETAVAAEVDETKFSHKMQVRINGATYYMMLTAT